MEHTPTNLLIEFRLVSTGEKLRTRSWSQAPDKRRKVNIGGANFRVVAQDWFTDEPDGGKVEVWLEPW